MLIHGLATFKDQTITDEELKGAFSNETLNKSVASDDIKSVKPKKRDISLKDFDYIWKRKIKKKLEVENQFKFENMMLLFDAYEYWKYENTMQFAQVDDEA
jgi:hypothetical protein